MTAMTQASARLEYPCLADSATGELDKTTLKETFPLPTRSRALVTHFRPVRTFSRCDLDKQHTLLIFWSNWRTKSRCQAGEHGPLPSECYYHILKRLPCSDYAIGRSAPAQESLCFVHSRP